MAKVLAIMMSAPARDIIFMHGPDDLRMGQIGVGAPRLAAHRHSAPLDIRARAAIEDDGFAVIEFLLNVAVHGGTITGLGGISSELRRAVRNARMKNCA